MTTYTLTLNEEQAETLRHALTVAKRHNIAHANACRDQHEHRRRIENLEELRQLLST